MTQSDEGQHLHEITTPACYNGCHVCKDLWRALAGVGEVESIVLGTFQEALASECPGHTPLVREFEAYCRNSESSFANEEPEDMGFAQDMYFGPAHGAMAMMQSVKHLGLYWNLLLVSRRAEQGASALGKGTILDPDWADLAVARQWKRQCLESHGAACGNPMKIWKTRPAWLVDVRRKCLVSGTDCDRFIALSYRRGSKWPFLRIDLAMLEKLQTPGILDDPTISAHLAPTLRHAIQLTHLLEERFVWVDALCISSVNQQETSEEILRMSAIYANAVLTIIAADGDCHDGLLGLKEVSGSRGQNQRVIPFGDEKIVVRNTDIFDMSSGSRYHRRGWTYQELRMSPRKILFRSQELHWECQCKVWHEELTLGSEVQPYIDTRASLILAGFPDLGSLSHILSRYNESELTYDEDALRGISGMLSIFSRSFLGGFLFGLPEMMFDRCLGWQPFWGHTDLRRRVHSGRSSTVSTCNSPLPSWTWIGWQGMIEVGREAVGINPLAQAIEETTPITTWYTGPSLEVSAPRREIKSTWFKDRSAFKDFDRPMPPGWSRHCASSAEHFQDEPRLAPDGCGDFVFQHCNMVKGSEYSSWYYPFPVADIDESTLPFMPDQTQYLFCETQRGYLYAQRQISKIDAETSDGFNRNLLDLVSESGRQVGCLHLHGREYLDGFPDCDTDEQLGRKIELIAIYKFRRHSKTWRETFERDDPINMEDYYQVLWIEWDKEVAYRLASGRVKLTAWESLELENVSVTLG